MKYAALASFFSRLALTRLLEARHPLVAPELGYFDAGVLFIDVSEFTILTERLSEKGPEGAEELTARSTATLACSSPALTIMEETWRNSRETP